MRFRPALAVASAVLLLAACSGGDEAEPDGPRTAVFGDEATCEKMTFNASSASQCGFVQCDFVPEGATFDETCGPYFQDGMSRSLTTAELDDLVLTHLVAVCLVTERADSTLSVTLADDTFVAFSGPTDWLDWVDEHAGTDCEA